MLTVDIRDQGSATGSYYDLIYVDVDVENRCAFEQDQDFLAETSHTVYLEQPQDTTL